MALTSVAKNRKWGHPCPMDTFLVVIVLHFSVVILKDNKM